MIGCLDLKLSEKQAQLAALPVVSTEEHWRNTASCCCPIGQVKKKWFLQRNLKINCVLCHRREAFPAELCTCVCLTSKCLTALIWWEKADVLDTTEVNCDINNGVYDITLLMLNISGTMYVRLFCCPECIHSESLN